MQRFADELGGRRIGVVQPHVGLVLSMLPRFVYPRGNSGRSAIYFRHWLARILLAAEVTVSSIRFARVSGFLASIPDIFIISALRDVAPCI